MTPEPARAAALRKPEIIGRLRTGSAIYAKVAGDLQSLLDTATREPDDWLPDAIGELRTRYLTEMDHRADEAARLLSRYLARRASHTNPGA